MFFRISLLQISYYQSMMGIILPLSYILNALFSWGDNKDNHKSRSNQKFFLLSPSPQNPVICRHGIYLLVLRYVNALAYIYK